MAAVYAAMYGSPRFAATEASTTMRPHPAVVMAGSARRMQRNGVVRLRSSMRCQSASVIRGIGADEPGAGVRDEDLDRPPRVLDRGEHVVDGTVGEQVDR